MSDSSPKSGADWRICEASAPALAVAGLTIAGLVACFHNDLAWPLQVLIAVAVMLVGGHAAWRLHRPRYTRLRVDGERVQFVADDRPCSGELVGQPFVSPVFVGFRWREAGRRLPRSFGVFRAQMTADAFRRLSATLRQRGEA